MNEKLADPALGFGLGLLLVQLPDHKQAVNLIFVFVYLCIRICIFVIVFVRAHSVTIVTTVVTQYYNCNNCNQRKLNPL